MVEDLQITKKESSSTEIPGNSRKWLSTLCTPRDPVAI